MFKITAILCLMIIGTTVWASRLSCDSCGSECAPVCGTRRFRTCCFNYLRRKRGPDAVKVMSPNNINTLETASKQKNPFFKAMNIPEQWFPNTMPIDFEFYTNEDNVEKRLPVQDSLNF